MAELSVEITAKIERLRKELSNAEGKLNGFEKTTNKIGGKVGQSNEKTGKSFNALNKGAANGGSAMTAFSRTIQDAPFGIMGVSNNITNLTEQFGYLRNKTGSAGGALRAMLTDLKGFGGITLLISLVTSAMLVFGDKLFKTKDEAKELREEQEALNKSLSDYTESLKGVDKAKLKGSQSAAKELTNLKLLKNQIDNTTLSDKDRLKAVNEMRRIYPSYLKNITDESILSGGLAKTYDILTTSILKRARATAASDSIVENTKKLLVLENQLSKEELKNGAKRDKMISDLAEAQNGTFRNDRKAIGLARALFKLEEGRVELVKQYGDISVENAKLELEVSAEGGIIDLSKLIPENTVPEVKEKVTALFENVYQDYNTGNATIINGRKDSTTGREAFQDLRFNRQVDFSSLGLKLQDKTIDWESYFNLKQLADQKLALDEQAMAINKSMDDLLVNNVSNSLSNLAEAIGSGTASATQAIMGGMGSLLSAMGDKLIQLGTAAVLAGTITSLFGSIAGIGAGLAAIAGGIALKAIGTGISGSFKGAGSDRGSVNSDTSKFSPSSGGSSSRSSDGGGFQNVVFQIEGTKLIGVISNTLRQNRALGGSLGII